MHLFIKWTTTANTTGISFKRAGETKRRDGWEIGLQNPCRQYFLINTNCLNLQPFFHVYLVIKMISSDIETEADDILFCV